MNKLQKLALLLPLLIVVGGIVRGEYVLRTGRAFRFELAGYDPRDLLRGQYLALRVRWNVEESSGFTDTPPPGSCLCLEPLEPLSPPRVSAASCTAVPESCLGMLRADEAARLTRFYVPESRAHELEQKLLDASRARRAFILLRVREDGGYAVEGLELAGERVDGVAAKP